MSFFKGAHRLPTVVATVVGTLAATLILAAPAAATTGTYVRLAQLTADTAGWELAIVSIGDPNRGLTVGGGPFGTVSEYVNVQPGDYVIGLQPVPNGDSAQLAGALTATAGSAYTVVAVGDAAQRRLQVLTDDLSSPGPGQAKVRVLGAVAAEPVQVSVAGQALPPLRAGEASGYVAVPAGAVPLGVGATELPLSLRAGEIGTVVIAAANGGFTAELHRDAAAPATVPAGAVGAGPGGVDHDRSGVVAMVGLAVACLGAAALLRRRRRVGLRSDR